MKYSIKSHLTLFIFVSIIILVGVINIPTTHAAVKNVVTGYAWSSNIGWIQFNPRGNTTDDVTISTTTLTPTIGDFSGYAWSSNIGWIKFGGLSGFPSSGFISENAKVNLTTGVVTGWARACSGTLNASPNQNLPGDCSSINPRTDGWDGWIELSGENHASGDSSGNGGVYYDNTNGKFKGYAWGGEVVGWVNFDPNSPTVTTIPPVTCTNNCGGGDTPITGSCSATDSSPNLTFTSYPSGGTGLYSSYTWTSTKNGSSIASNSTGLSIIYNSTIPGEVYAANVTITDSNNNTGTISCGPTTVATPTSTGPLLWFEGGTIPTGVGDTKTKTVREGQNVEVLYNRTGLFCKGRFNPPTPSGFDISSNSIWTDQDSIVNNTDTDISGNQKYKFTSLVKGTYNIDLICSPPHGAIGQSSWLANIMSSIFSLFALGDTPSNTIKIIVTKTSIEEI